MKVRNKPRKTKARIKAPPADPTRLDPTRTHLLRQKMTRHLKMQFGLIKADVLRVVEAGDFDLTANSLTVNPFVSEAQRRACYAANDPDWDCEEWEGHTANKSYFSDCPRDKKGRCLPSGAGPEGTGSGTRDDPVNCGSNLKLALESLAAGKHVRLDQPRQVATLIDHMHNTISHAVRNKKVPPHFDLCKVSVPHTNLFCEDSFDLPRAQMPQMRGLPVPGSYADGKPRNAAGKVDVSAEFIRHLRDDHDIKVTEEERPTSHLRASQQEIVGARVAELVHAAEHEGKDLRKRPIFITRDGYVLDGHHHWAAIVAQSAARGKDLSIPVHVVDTDIGTAITLANDFARVAGIAPKSGQPARGPDHPGPTANVEWEPDPDIIRRFEAWLRRTIGRRIENLTEEQLWQAYIEEGWRKGMGRAFDESWVPDTSRLDFTRESRDEFLRSSFNRPVSVERVKVMAGQAYEELNNVSRDMAAKMRRRLVDGLIQGKNSRQIARVMVEEVDISRQRAELIAQTELIRAHAEGQLEGFERMGVEELGVMVEWSTAGDLRVCKKCAALKGIVVRTGEAHGMNPRHPRCRCAWVPANLGESPRGQRRGKSMVDAAIARSRRNGKDRPLDDWGPNGPISKVRPKSKV